MLNDCTRLDSVVGVLNVESYIMVPYRVKYQYGRWNMEEQRKILSLLLGTGN